MKHVRALNFNGKFKLTVYYVTSIVTQTEMEAIRSVRSRYAVYKTAVLANASLRPATPKRPRSNLCEEREDPVGRRARSDSGAAVSGTSSGGVCLSKLPGRTSSERDLPACFSSALLFNGGLAERFSLIFLSPFTPSPSLDLIHASVGEPPGSPAEEEALGRNVNNRSNLLPKLPVANLGRILKDGRKREISTGDVYPALKHTAVRLNIYGKWTLCVSRHALFSGGKRCLCRGPPTKS